MNRQKQASLLRITRKIHRVLGIFLFVFFLLIGCTALLLGWKKHSSGYLLPDTLAGEPALSRTEIAMDSVQQIARTALMEFREDLSPDIDRLDIRPDQGIAKVTFKAHYWEVQVDLTTGAVLQVALRRSDFIENLHDGSYFDKVLHTDGDPIKLVYTSLMGSALIAFSLTGFWLWFGPKVMRKTSAKRPS